jgi:hypothetical protein
MRATRETMAVFDRNPHPQQLYQHQTTTKQHWPIATATAVMALPGDDEIDSLLALMGGQTPPANALTKATTKAVK